MGVPHYPKIWSLGNDAIESLFIGEVEITEKVDGSLFAFGVDRNGEICIRSKGKEMFIGSQEKMFDLAVDQVEKRRDLLLDIYKEDGPFYIYGEFLSKPKHNVLCYSRVPKDNIMVFGWKVGQNFIKQHDCLKRMAENIGFEAVPLLFSGEFKDLKVAGETDYEKFKNLIQSTTSALEDQIIEGVVIKNYYQIVAIGAGTDPCFGKYVREDFKEKLHKEWGTISGKNAFQEFVDGFRAEARWLKAIQHLRDEGRLTNSPKDIGLLLKYVPDDIFEEETQFIKDKLFNLFKDQIRRRSTAGLPEFYKDYLTKRQFNYEKEEQKNNE